MTVGGLQTSNTLRPMPNATGIVAARNALGGTGGGPRNTVTPIRRVGPPAIAGTPPPVARPPVAGVGAQPVTSYAGAVTPGWANPNPVQAPAAPPPGSMAGPSPTPGRVPIRGGPTPIRRVGAPSTGTGYVPRAGMPTYSAMPIMPQGGGQASPWAGSPNGVDQYGIENGGYYRTNSGAMNYIINPSGQNQSKEIGYMDPNWVF